MFFSPSILPSETVASLVANSSPPSARYTNNERHRNGPIYPQRVLDFLPELLFGFSCDEVLLKDRG
jgi:hypothetical protein